MQMNIQDPQPNSEQAKVFFALWPSVALRRSLHALALQQQSRHGGHATRKEDLHLTLLFLGAVERDRLPVLQQMADTLEFRTFSFSLQQIAYWRHNRIAYAAPSADIPPLQALSEHLRRLADNAGITFDRRPFTPHVTLLRRVNGVADPQPIKVPAWRVEAVSLVESLSDSQGGRYRNLQTWHGRE